MGLASIIGIWTSKRGHEAMGADTHVPRIQIRHATTPHADDTTLAEDACKAQHGARIACNEKMRLVPAAKRPIGGQDDRSSQPFGKASLHAPVPALRHAA